jgi:hypothetical protein
MRSGNPFAARSGLWWLTFALLVVCGVGGQTAVHLATGKSFVGALLSTIFGMMFVAVVLYVWRRWASQPQDA